MYIKRTHSSSSSHLVELLKVLGRDDKIRVEVQDVEEEVPLYKKSLSLSRKKKKEESMTKPKLVFLKLGEQVSTWLQCSHFSHVVREAPVMTESEFRT